MKNNIDLSNMIKGYIGKESNNCAFFIREILLKQGIDANVPIDDVKQHYAEIIKTLEKIGYIITDKPKSSDLILLINEEKQIGHLGIFIDNYGRFFHLHNCKGIISNLSNIKKKHYLFRLEK